MEQFKVEKTKKGYVVKRLKRIEVRDKFKDKKKIPVFYKYLFKKKSILRYLSTGTGLVYRGRIIANNGVSIFYCTRYYETEQEALEAIETFSGNFEKII